MKRIYEIKNYTDKTGRIVIKFESQNGNAVEFFGSATVATEDGKRIPIQFPFSEEIKSVTACFENFDSASKSFIENKLKAPQPSASPAETPEKQDQGPGGRILKFERPKNI